MKTSWARVLTIDTLLVTAWLTSIGSVIVHERGSIWGWGVNPVASLRATTEVSEQWFGIYYQGEKIGYASTMVMPEEIDGMPGVSVIDRGRLSFSLLGAPQVLDISARASIDADWRLQRFWAKLHTQTYELNWSGRRDGESLVMTVGTGQDQHTKRLRDPGGSAFVVGLSPWTTFRSLRMGQWGSIWILNPLALSPEEVYFNVREKTQIDGEDVLVIETDFRGMTATSWVTEDGDVIREESPLGWELRRESQEEALREIWKMPTLDLLATTSVPIDRILEDPNRITRLIVLVHGLSAADITIERPWQSVLPPEQLKEYRTELPSGTWSVIELHRPERIVPIEGVAEHLERYRRPSFYVQSDDARIQSQAQEIIGEIADPWLQLVALHEWVFVNLTKRITVGLPSAVDVMVSKSGDCHEHTILFTALARSAGLPTRMVAGLVYYGGRLYYHAWPEVWLGEWVPTDPTLGELIANATHIGLIEAESEDLVALGKFVGQLRIEVLEVEEGE